MRAITNLTDIDSYIDFMHRVNRFRQILDQSLRDTQLDVVLCPAFGMAAPVPIQSKVKMSGMLTFCNLFNIANMPAGTVPSGYRIQPEDLELPSGCAQSAAMEKALRVS